MMLMGGLILCSSSRNYMPATLSLQFPTISIAPVDIYLVSRRRESVLTAVPTGGTCVYYELVRVAPGPPASLSFAHLVVERHLLC